MAANEIRLNDIGLDFIITIYSGGSIKDLSTFTTKQLIFRKPSGTSVTKTADFITDGTDGQIRYLTLAGDLDETGIWKIQARISDGGVNDKKTDMATFTVGENL